VNYHVTIELHFSEGPRSRILAIEQVAQAICEAVGQDPADATMMLLTAASHVATQHATKPGTISDILADCLGNAIVAAKSFFP
jgi:hypothetical protein